MIEGERLSRRRFLGGAAAAGAGLALTACQGGSSTKEDGSAETDSSGEPKRGGVLRTASATPIISLDPHTTEGVAVALYFYSYVVHATDWQGNVGDLATSWENPDELSWVFNLRDDVHFQDIPPVNGRLLVAQDVVNTFDRQRSLPGASTDELIVKYEAPDPRTLTMQTKEPHGYMIVNMGSPGNAIIPIEAVEQFGDLADHVIGSGPFMLDTLARDDLEVVRNPTYYHDYPYVDGVAVKVLADAFSQQAAFRAGSLDAYIAENKTQADAVKGVAGTILQRYLSRVYSVFALNGQKVEAFKDERVREAIDLSLDRQSLIDKLHFGDAELAGPIPPLWDTALPKEEIEAAYQRDVAKARQLLSAAGQEGLSFELSFYTLAQNADRASIIKENLAEAGVNANLASADLGLWLANLMDGNFQSTAFNHLPYLSDFIQIQSHYSTGAARNPKGYLGVDDPEVDALLTKERQAIDDEERKQYCLEAQRLILKRHGPTLTLCEPYAYWVAYDYLKGYTPTAYGFGLFRYNMWIDKD
jgi:peptide/nickel transport system substrate-binding protein